MIRFRCDYSEGAHPKILERMMETNDEQFLGYGDDPCCARAADYIRRDCQLPEADVHFLSGGTQANMVTLAAVLRPYQGVITPDSGHINGHEGGAVEATGHKLYQIPNENGKISAAQIQAFIDAHYSDNTYDQLVEPAVVYITQPTESGSLYSRAEFEAIYDVCRKAGLLLYVDGARLGYGLGSPENDLDLPTMAKMCDAFYIGGTKVGAMFGEAIVINNPIWKKGFRGVMKQHGGRLAKGWILGRQFEVLFEDGLYYEIGKHAVDMAYKLRDAFRAKGYEFMCESPTNQQFPIIPKEHLAKLDEKYTYFPWLDLGDGRMITRFCTSWATPEASVDALIKDLEAL